MEYDVGLDGLELILATEETFGVSLRDEDLSKAKTPRDLAKLVFEQLHQTDEAICQTHRAFNVLRRGLTTVLGVPRSQVTLEFNFGDLIPRDKQRETWLRLKNEVDARSWPVLAYPKWISIPRLIVGLILTLTAFFFALLIPVVGIAIGLPASIILGLVYAIGSNRLLSAYRNRLPTKFCHVKKLLPYVTTSTRIEWTFDQTLDRLRTVVIEKLGLKESQYHHDARFKEDLAVDQ